jgi:hypothetical protein
MMNDWILGGETMYDHVIYKKKTSESSYVVLDTIIKKQIDGHFTSDLIYMQQM